ncbi:hypothetical protein RhiJN_18454 [Ceratobasidium sp. AG-Ba]|nr:hypothetical protein RhiJN_18454 [Ceratobasidium sp. AG-Ba]
MRLADKFPKSFISIFTHPVFVFQIQKYLSTYPHLAPGRIVVDASTFGNPSNHALDLLEDMEKGFGPWIASQMEQIEFISNGVRVDTPSYIIEDHLNGGISVTNMQFHQLPIAGWYVATATGFIGHFGNAEHGQGWRHFEAVRASVAKHGLDDRTLLDVYAQDIIKDRVVCAPGVPAYYEHEQIPQPQSTALPMIVRMHGKWMAMLEHINAIVYSSLYEMEPIAAKASAKGLLKPIPSFCTGLAMDVPPQSNMAIDENTEDPVALFMNRSYTDLGQHSVVYLSFGSYCHPSPESISHLKILIEEILAHDFRLVFSIQKHNARNAGLEEDYIRQIVNTGRAIFPEWAKQLDDGD